MRAIRMSTRPNVLRSRFAEGIVMEVLVIKHLSTESVHVRRLSTWLIASTSPVATIYRHCAQLRPPDATRIHYPSWSRRP